VRAEGGIDISRFAIANFRPDMRAHCRIGSLADPIDGRYDVVTCIEVLEHMEIGEAQQAIEQLCAVTDTVIFSSTPSDFAEATHVNVCPPIVWLDLFAAHGFGPDFSADGSFLTAHTMIFRRGLPCDNAALRGYALLVRYRILAQARLEAIEAERQTAHRAGAELESLRASAAGNRTEIEQLRAQCSETEHSRARVEELTRELSELHASYAGRYDVMIGDLKGANQTIDRLNHQIDGLQRNIASTDAMLVAADPPDVKPVPLPSERDAAISVVSRFSRRLAFGNRFAPGPAVLKTRESSFLVSWIENRAYRLDRICFTRRWPDLRRLVIAQPTVVAA
jgi:hypothetical protein